MAFFLYTLKMELLSLQAYGQIFLSQTLSLFCLHSGPGMHLLNQQDAIGGCLQRARHSSVKSGCSSEQAYEVHAQRDILVV